MINKNRWWLIFVIYVGEHTFPVHASMSAQPHTLEAHPDPFSLGEGEWLIWLISLGKGTEWAQLSLLWVLFIGRQFACRRHIFSVPQYTMFSRHTDPQEKLKLCPLCAWVCKFVKFRGESARPPACRLRSITVLTFWLSLESLSIQAWKREV